MIQLVLLNLVVLGITFAHLFFIHSEFVLAQSDNRVGDLEGYVVDSKFVTITDHRYQHGDISDAITGTVMNNSTQEISVISVIALLYDKDNNLITTGIGSADASDLPGGGNSAFSIHFVIKESEVNHYTLFPGGIP